MEPLAALLVMDLQKNSFDLIEQHNAEYPREIQLAREISRLLKTANFPGERIWVDLRFDYSMVDHTSSTVDLMKISGEVHGIVIIKVQGLFAHQDFNSMFGEALPHEVAHVLHEIQAKENETEVTKPHDETWQDIVSVIAPDVTPVAKIKGSFDDRAIRMLKGGIAAACECGDEDAFAVFPDSPGTSTKLRNEELTCSTCRFPFARIEQAQWPKKVCDEIKFLEGVRSIKLHHTHLQR